MWLASCSLFTFIDLFSLFRVFPFLSWAARVLPIPSSTNIGEQVRWRWWYRWLPSMRLKTFECKNYCPPSILLFSSSASSTSSSTSSSLLSLTPLTPAPFRVYKTRTQAAKLGARLLPQQILAYLTEFQKLSNTKSRREATMNPIFLYVYRNTNITHPRLSLQSSLSWSSCPLFLFLFLLHFLYLPLDRPLPPPIEGLGPISPNFQRLT